jgi:hypothetical protein
MPIIDADYSFDDAHCKIIFAGFKSDTFPLFMDRDWVELIKKNSKLQEANSNTCGEKARFLASNISRNQLADNPCTLIMSDWLSSHQPNTPFKSIGITTGASYHALAYFEKNGLYFACDLNTYSESRKPYLQIFASENQETLFKLLNGVYAVKTIHIGPKELYWMSIAAEKNYQAAKFSEITQLEDIFNLSVGSEQSTWSEEVVNQVSVLKETNNTEAPNILLKNIVTQELSKIESTYRTAPNLRREIPATCPNPFSSRVRAVEPLSGISMQILGGFLSALGIAAVSIAFAALNLATFGTSGLVVGMLGLISLGTGVGFFAVERKRSNNEIELSSPKAPELAPCKI